MMNATLALSTPAQQAILYAAGPFYGWPWKPTLNEAHGCSYAVAYAHFRRDHSTPYNLVLHCLCLVMQLLGNFLLLTVLDARFSKSAKYPVLRFTTAIAWIAALALPSECPAPARALSVAAVVAAATLAPRLNVESWWTALPLLQLTIGAMGIELILLPEDHAEKKIPPYVGFAVVFVVFAALWRLLATKLRGCAKRFGAPAIAVVLAAMVSLARKDDPVKPVNKLGGIVVWPLALLTDRPELCLYSFGYTAMAAQGIAHRLSGQPSTLEQVQVLDDGVSKLSFEWAHVVYFPALLFHSVLESLAA